MFFSVIICTFRRAESLRQTLQTVVNQSFKSSDFEIIVADNNSGDATAAVVRHFADNYPRHSIKYCLETRQGGSFARNAGAQLAVGEILIFFDDDVLVAENYLQSAADFFPKNTAVGAVGGKILPKYLPHGVPPDWMHSLMESLAGKFDVGSHVTILDKKFPFEGNVAYRKADFEAVGGFDAAIAGVIDEKRVSGEGKDLIFRVRKSGKKIAYHPEMQVFHCVNSDGLSARFDNITTGIGRGEFARLKKSQNPTLFIFIKKLEYLAKLWFVRVMGIFLPKLQAAQLIRFRKNVLIGFREDAAK